MFILQASVDYDWFTSFLGGIGLIYVIYIFSKEDFYKKFREEEYQNPDHEDNMESNYQKKTYSTNYTCSVETQQAVSKIEKIKIPQAQNKLKDFQLLETKLVSQLSQILNKYEFKKFPEPQKLFIHSNEGEFNNYPLNSCQVIIDDFRKYAAFKIDNNFIYFLITEKENIGHRYIYKDADRINMSIGKGEGKYDFMISMWHKPKNKKQLNYVKIQHGVKIDNELCNKENILFLQDALVIN